MTCHIAMSSAAGAIMFSDSQASDGVSELHGVEKQFCGSDFLLGGAGAGDVITALFDYLSGVTTGTLTAATVEDSVRAFMSTEVQREAAGSIQLLVVSGTTPAVRSYNPRVFTRFGKPSEFMSIGSGASFAGRALTRDRKLGIYQPCDGLADLLVAIHGYAEASNESLTVNDRYLVGVVSGDRTYLMGDADIHPTHAPTVLLAQWSDVCVAFDEIRGIAATISGELHNAQRAFSGIKHGDWSAMRKASVQNSADSIVMNRMNLATRLTSYFRWYDGLLGRPPRP